MLNSKMPSGLRRSTMTRRNQRQRSRSRRRTRVRRIKRLRNERPGFSKFGDSHFVILGYDWSPGFSHVAIVASKRFESNLSMVQCSYHPHSSKGIPLKVYPLLMEAKLCVAGVRRKNQSLALGQYPVWGPLQSERICSAADPREKWELRSTSCYELWCILCNYYICKLLAN